ncbi:MAG: DUF739 family protein [Chitinispirillales bacterium]|jgi:hypothetical protein|nr:DUF739 family protein [Chitinispirillales bacterium]
MNNKQLTYPRLRGKIREVCGTEGIFARELGLTHKTLIQRLAGRTPFSINEVEKATTILGIEKQDVAKYFFVK